MKNIINYIADTAQALKVPKEEIYDVVIALMAIDTNEEDIEGALKVMINSRDGEEILTKKTREAVVKCKISGMKM